MVDCAFQIRHTDIINSHFIEEKCSPCCSCESLEEESTFNTNCTGAPLTVQCEGSVYTRNRHAHTSPSYVRTCTRVPPLALSLPLTHRGDELGAVGEWGVTVGARVDPRTAGMVEEQSSHVEPDVNKPQNAEFHRSKRTTKMPSLTQLTARLLSVKTT